MDEVAGVICFGTFVLAIVAVVWALVHRGSARRNVDLETELRELRRRVTALENRLALERRVEPDVPPAAVQRTPAPSPPPPAPARAALVDEPPPLPFPPPLKPVERAAASPRELPRDPASAPLPATPAPAVHRRPVAASPAKPALSLEAFLGGRVMLIVGVVVGLLGVAFFLKYMIDQGLLGQGARIAMGVMAGAGLLAGGEVMRRRGFDVFGQALMGFGLGALYLSNYFACSIYDMIGPTAAFVLTAGITAAGAALALRRSAPVLAYLGFLGGYMAPWLLSKKSGDLAGLTVWLCVLDAGLLFVLLRRAWRGLDLLALVATSVYVAVWFDRHAEGSNLGTACACLAALLAASLVLGLAPAIARKERLTGQSLVGVVVAGALSVVAGHALLFPAHRWELGAGVVALGAAYYLASTLVVKRVEGARADAESLLGFAAAALATAVAVVASGNAVSPALSAAGLAIVFAGTRTRHGVLLACGVGAIALACGDLLLFRLDMFDEAATPFLNERFFVFACPCVALLVAGRLLTKAEGVKTETATLVAGVGLLVLPIVLAGDLYRGFRPIDDLHRELRYVAPAAALAVYGFLSSRLFGKDSALGRMFAFAPVLFALAFGVALLLHGHVGPFTPLVNPTFVAGMLIVTAARFASGPGEERTRGSFGEMATLFLLALVTAEIHAWGETSVVRSRDERKLAEFAARNWIAIAWAAFATVLALAELVRRWKSLAWFGTGRPAAERGIAVFALAGALVWHVAVHFGRHGVGSWAPGHAFRAPLAPFANLVFAAGLAIVAAAHVVGRAPFDGLRRAVRIVGLAYLLAVVTIEIQWWGDRRYWAESHDAMRALTELDTAAWTTITWALFAAAIAWMGAARKTPALRWVGIDDERIEAGMAHVPLAGAAFWGIATMAGERPEAFPIFVNLHFAAGLVVAVSAFAVAQRNSGGVRDAVRVCAVLWGLALLTAEIHAWGRTCPIGAGTREEAEFRAIVWISVVWAIYAAALVGIGFARKQAGLRWMGLGVFALTLGKVILVDMAQLDAVYRIGSFLVLGALLVAASFLYQRARRSEPPTT